MLPPPPPPSPNDINYWTLEDERLNSKCFLTGNRANLIKRISSFLPDDGGGDGGGGGGGGNDAEEEKKVEAEAG